MTPHVQEFDAADLSDAWIEGDETARWRSTSAHGSGTGAEGSGSSMLEVEPGCRLPAHTDSAEETIVVVEGRAEVLVEGEPAGLARGIAVVPANAKHEVRNAGAETLRFAAVYADSDVTTTYEQPVQPAGDSVRGSTA